MKKLSLLVLALIAALALSACGNNEEPSLATDVEVEISMISWAGDGVYYDDIGHTNLSVEDLTNPKVAAVYANAKAFNEIYPNVTINYYGKQYGPNDGGVSWEDEILNFKEVHGDFPNVIPLTDTTGFLQKGYLADLSRFEDDAYFKMYNPGLLEQTNFYGFQAAVPGYFIPAGIFINPEIIEDENLDEQSPDWSFSEFTSLITSGEKGQGSDSYVSVAGMPDWWIQQEFLYNQLFDGPMDGKYVSLNNDYVKTFFDDGVRRWVDYEIYNQADETFMEDNKEWGVRAFSNGAALVLGSEPWYITDFSTSTGQLPGPDGFDIYPFPSFEGSGNTISTISDPVGIFNSCRDDGFADCTEEEELKIQVAYTFQAFTTNDSASWEARVAQQYTDTETGTVETGVLDSSFPVTTGDLYDEQMELWFSSPRHAYYDNPNLVGFQAVNDLIKSGSVKAISDKAYPWFYVDPDSGETRRIFEEFLSYHTIDGVGITDSGWYDAFAAKLPEWETLFNDRLDQAWADIQTGLVTHYGYAEDDERFNQ